jgi:ABC-type Fe3+ transport system substrate-binding protein
MRYRTPLREFLRPGFVDQEGDFNATFTRAFMFIVNKNLVAAKDYPKSFANLLEAKWKGKLVMDNESYDLLAACWTTTVRAKASVWRRTWENRSRVFAAAPLWLANWSPPANSR